MAVRAGRARRYADALFAIALERSTVDEWETELNRLRSAAMDPQVTRVLTAPRLGVARKRQLLEALAGPLSK